MPNGGNDCCWTCPFNTLNKGKTGIPRRDPRYRGTIGRTVSRVLQFFHIHWFGPFGEGQPRCLIRDFVIDDELTTYCVNHPAHNQELVDVPVGPVFVELAPVVRDGAVYSLYDRGFWKPSPDTEEIRLKLLQLLQSMPETPRREYPTSPQFDEVVIAQLQEFRERRAIPGLRRVIQFDPFASPPGDPSGRNRIQTIADAIAALAAIAGDEACAEIERGVRCGLEQLAAAGEYDKERDVLAPIRYCAVLGLAHCSYERSVVLLQAAMNDPDEAVAAAARKIYAKEKP